MERDKLLELYWERRESAIVESERQYGKLCYQIAYQILANKEDSEECVNDTWFQAWKAIPPERPNYFAAFFGKITRNLSFNRYKAKRAIKRGGGEIELILEELEECIPSKDNVEQKLLEQELKEILNQFLWSLPKRECNIFLARYWYSKHLSEIADEFCMKENNVKASLFRSRRKLLALLKKEGIYL